MSGKKTSQQKRSGLLTRVRPQVIIPVGFVLSLIAALTMLANSGAFDSSLRQKGKQRQTVSLASLNSNSPSKEYVYAGGRLIATEEASGVGCATISPPQNLTATATTATSVSLSWDPPAPGSGSVVHYEIQRRQTLNPNDWVTLPLAPTGPTATDSPVTGGIAYLYQVRAIGIVGCGNSGYSNVDLATTIIFDDPQLQGQVIRAQHVTQLRQAVDAVLVTAGIGAASWTNPLDHQVSAIHFSELRTRLNDALGPLGFSQILPDSGIAQGLTVYAMHLQAVRDKVR